MQLIVIHDRSELFILADPYSQLSIIDKASCSSMQKIHSLAASDKSCFSF